jgi:hypothetical protein
MHTINRPSMVPRMRATLAAVIVLAAAAPAAARINFGSCTVSDGVGWDCSGKGGSLTCDGGVAYCCKSSGKGKDFVRICDELDQVIDLDLRVPATTTTTLPRMLGFPRPLYKY